MRVIGLRAHCHVARAVSVALDTPFEPLNCTTYADGEWAISGGPETFAAGEPVVLAWTYQLGGDDINAQFFKVIAVAAYLKARGATTIIGVCPYLLYGRQDQAAGMAHASLQLLHAAGVDQLLTVHPHGHYVRSPLPVVALPFTTPWVQVIDQLVARDGNAVLVAPDAGGVARVQELAQLTGLPVREVKKERFADGSVGVTGDKSGWDNQHVLIFDDIIDRGHTVMGVANFCLQHGARSVRVCATHGVLSGNAVTALTRSDIAKVLVSNLFDDRRGWDNDTVCGVSMHDAFAQAAAVAVRKRVKLRRQLAMQ